MTPPVGGDRPAGPVRGGPQIIPRPERWSPGRPAPWEGMDVSAGALGPRRARQVYAGRVGVPAPVAATGARPSAVLVPVYEEGGGLHVVLTRRAWTLRTHKGEVSFPGGRADDGEAPAQTALREACEEIALDPGGVEVLGEMDHLTTVTRRAYIVPVVGLLDRRPELSAHDGEVEAVLHVALEELLSPGVFREERWGPSEVARPVYFFELFGDTVWGATASMLRHLLVQMLDLPEGPPEDYDPARDTAGWRPPLPPGVADELE